LVLLAFLSVFSWKGKRGGKKFRQRTQTCETTPDASGNACNELEQMTKDKINDAAM